MMNDWTEIIGKQLGSMNEPLPADDWKVLQQKYSTRQRAAAWRWTSSIAATAAAVLLIFFISKPEETVPHSNLIAEEISHTEEIIPSSYTPAPDSCTPIPVELPSHKTDIINTETAPEKPSGQEMESPDSAPEATEDTTGEASIKTSTEDTANEKDKIVKEYKYPALDNLLEEPEQNKAWHKVSIGISGAIFSPMREYGEISYGSSAEPADTSCHKKAATKSLRNDFNFDKYDHEMPVSFGISARVNLNGVLAVSTGINYTRYESKRTTSTQGYTKSSTQNVHYIGIPVRFDLILADSKNLSLYLGAGMQVDKCLWAKAWGETLHEKEFLWSVTCAGGLQVNLSPTAALYLEPEISRALNTGSLQTYRTEENSTICLRAGLRFTLK